MADRRRVGGAPTRPAAPRNRAVRETQSASDPEEERGLMVYLAADGVVAWTGAAHRALIAETECQRIALAEREERRTG